MDLLIRSFEKGDVMLQSLQCGKSFVLVIGHCVVWFCAVLQAE